MMWRGTCASHEEERHAEPETCLRFAECTEAYPPWFPGEKRVRRWGSISRGPFDSDGNASVINYRKVRSIIFYARHPRRLPSDVSRFLLRRGARYICFWFFAVFSSFMGSGYNFLRVRYALLYEYKMKCSENDLVVEIEIRCWYYDYWWLERRTFIERDRINLLNIVEIAKNVLL